MPRRFEYVGGTSAKFYEISVGQCRVNIRYGRLGTEGKSLTKDFDSANAALREFNKLVGQKIAKGYVECAVC